MKIRYVKFRNFLSYGNSFTTVHFNSQRLTRITGKVGSGKSTLIDVIKFALFGKAYRKINKSLILNKVNQANLFVELAFSVDKDNYKVQRGIKPNIFNIYKNGNLIDLSNKTKDYQKILEDIIGFDERIFDQIIVKSLTKQVSFFTLPKNERIKLFEQFLISYDIELFKNFLKDKSNALKRELDSVEKDVKNLEILIEDNTSNLHQLNEILNQENEKNENLLKEKKKFLKLLKFKIDFYKKYKEILSPYKNKYNEVSERLNSLKRLEEKLTNRNNLIKQYSENVCGNCKKLPKLVDFILNEELDVENDVHDEIEKLENELGKYKAKNEVLNRVNKVLINLVNQFKLEKENLKLFKTKNNEKITQQINSIEQKIINYKQQHTELYKKYLDLKEKVRLYEKLRNDVLPILRKNLIKQYLKIINDLINKYLEKLELNTIKITSDFELVGLDYYNYSEGEKKKLDIAVILTFLEIFIKKYNDINILFLDEITSGLDGYSEEQLMYLLKTFAKTYNKEIIIISHSEISNEFFNRILNVEKIKGFSKIIAEKGEL